MTYPPTPRIAWSPDADRLLTCQAGCLRLLEIDDDRERTLPGDGYLDARFLANGGIAALDGRTIRYRFTLHGDPYGGLPEPHTGAWYQHAHLGADGERMASCSGTFGALRVDNGVETYWSFEPPDRTLRLDGHHTTAVLSDDAKLVAIGFQSAVRTNKRTPRPAGRGWFVVDTTVKRSWDPKVAPADIISQRWYEHLPSERPFRFAFDRARRRLAIAGPDDDDGRGVIRLETDESYAPRLPATGTAGAVALDPKGSIAAYAIANRVQFDFLTPTADGPPLVEVTDSVTFDTDLAEVTAIAFDPQSRWLACLGGDHAVQILPVP